jgi:adenylate cyclase
MKRLGRWARGFGLGRVVCLLLLAALTVLRVWDPPPLAGLRARTFDFYQQLRPNETTLRPAVIVDIDEESLATLGQWPWPRTRLADLVDRLTQAGAAVIAFDILFPEPDGLSPALAANTFRDIDEETRARLRALPSNDEALAAAMRRSRVVVGESGLHRPTPKADVPLPATGFAMMGPDPRRFLIDFPGIVRNIPVLEQAAAGRGMLTIRTENDGIVRRVPLVLVANGAVFPSLTLDMLRAVTGAGAIRVKTDAAGVKSVAIPGLEMPTDANGQLWIHFSPHDPRRYISARDVLAGTVPRDRIERRLVLIGTSAVGLRDIKTTPIDPGMSGVEVHAQVLENMLTGSMLFYPNYAVGAELAASVLMGLAIIVFGPMLGATTMLALGAAVAAILAGGSWYFFTQHRILLDATGPLLSTLLIYLTLIFINYFREQFQRRRIRHAFGQYLSPSLVEELATSHDKLVLGGEDREMTVMFSDIRGFTTISEAYKQDPQGLTSLINRFLTPMTDAIVARQGTIDKYIGDAIMAFWNAPLRDAAHACNACGAALEMLDRVGTLNRQREQEARESGQPFIPIKIGIGLNTGRCVVGNMGSDLRFNYSVLGDAVNLASRLEGQTKNYGVPVVIGSQTAAAARETYAVLEIDLITVKGKLEPETIYALLGREDVARGEPFAELQRLLGEVLALYRARDFEAAGRAVVRCRPAAEAFGLARVLDIYSIRVASFQQAAPPIDWNGVFVLDTK